MNVRPGLVLAITLVTAAGCKDRQTPASAAAASSPAPAPARSTAPNFELDCDSSDTASASQLFCVRTDTRNGDIKQVLYLGLPVSDGPTAVKGATTPGKFQTVCDATSTDTHSDFYCIRLDTETGDMVLVNLQKVHSIPELTGPPPRGTVVP